MGNGVVERTKESVATRTVTGSNLGHGRRFSSGSHGVWRERPPSPDWAWQKPKDAQMKFCRKPPYMHQPTQP